ncbi:DUF3667 domain-containing protein [Flavobacterium sp.]|uniref:DUF3667 domain-containing protein n=1 Tax=Flavobacterium sp. TaxID=239 RepID=UPI002605AE8F|nr:DUF3667 domain-containing protein [Flavobacterium sp.]
MDCKNCNKEVTSKFCPECGQPTNLKRIDGKYIIHEIEHVLHFERGILYTIRELTTNPGQNIRNYLIENRSRLVKPILFIIITSLIYTILNHLFHMEDGYVKFHEAKDEASSAVGSIVKWVQGHYGYANIMMGVFIALWLKLFFRKSNYNFFEILIMLCFVMGMGMLIFSIFVIMQGITHFNLMTIAGVTGVAYCVWAIGQFYDKKKPLSYIKGLFAYILGMITFWIFPVLIGTIIDLINKY